LFRIAAPLPIIALVMALAMPASAQYSDNRAVYDRLDRMERDLQMVQQQLARGSAGSTVVTSPSAPAGIAPRSDDRVDQLEEMIRRLTGMVEEANHKAAQAQRQMEKMQADVDLRFKELQGAPAGAALATAGQQPAAAVQMPAAGGKPGANSAAGDGLAPGPQPLGTISDKDLKKQQTAANGAPVLTPPPELKDPEGLYQSVYALVQKGDYPAAEEGFRNFLAKFPNHALAGNAAFWQAETVYAQKNYEQAVKLYAEAYKKYPKNTKAPDMLYKLGASYMQMDMKKEACLAYKVLFSEHPTMGDRLKKAAQADKQRLGCAG
jgi:tol-pal system protein YbgF